MISNSFIILILCIACLIQTTCPKKITNKTQPNPHAWLSPFDRPEVVIKTKLIHFKEEIQNSYNPSIIEQGNGYLLVFRHDTSRKCCNRCGYKQPEIKMVMLDKNFLQTGPIKTVKSDAAVAEDARIHSWNQQLFLTYNDDPHLFAYQKKRRNSPSRQISTQKLADHLVPHQHPSIRRLFNGKLNWAKRKLSDIRSIPSGCIQLAPVEKNWMPFEYPEHGGSLYYIYSTSPHRVIEIGNLDKPESITINGTGSQRVDSIWKEDTWGQIKGGTPARLVDDVYITFFHSWKFFPEQKSYIYFMGSYIFQAQPPFDIIAITPHPIIFNEIYSARHRVDNLHAIYPGGFVIEKKDTKTILHVSCGENDTSIRIVSIDKDALLKSMVPLT